MWPEKKQQQQKQECPDPFKDKVKCEECKHYIDKKDSTEVQYLTLYSTQTLFYCPMHKKPYNKKTLYFATAHYFQDMEVDREGTPVGYKKVKK